MIKPNISRPSNQTLKREDKAITNSALEPPRKRKKTTLPPSQCPIHAGDAGEFDENDVGERSVRGGAVVEGSTRRGATGEGSIIRGAI